MIPRLRGRFVTLEGGEGAGKSTLQRALRARLEAGGRAVVATREPGGSPKAEAIRDLLLSGAVRRLGPFAEAVLFASARDSHLEEVIRPALHRGAVVLCDRFADSTRAYQGAAGGVDDAVLAALERVVVGQTRPDLTLLVDVPPDLGLGRVDGRAEGRYDRFEKEDLGFHERLRAAFLDIARREPGRVVVIDGSRSPAEVERTAWRLLSERLALPAPKPRA